MRIIDGTAQRVFAIGDTVRFKEQYLNARPNEAKRFVGRVGKVSGYRMGAAEPIIEFAKDGRRTAQKIFEVPIAALELASAGNQKT
jgi:hypothetical protein